MWQRRKETENQMSGNRVWQRVASWFQAKAEHVTVEFLPEPGSTPLMPYQGYLRLWLVEGFLTKRRTWGNDHYPALHGGVTLTFLGSEPVSFTNVTRPTWTSRGATFDEYISPLVPYNGGVVTIQAGLYQVSEQGPLGAAVQVIGSLAGLMGPPLATAATIASKVSEGLDAVLDGTGDQPVLGVQLSMIAPGGGGRPVQAGHIVVIDAPEPPGRLEIVGGRLHAAGNQVTGHDYLVLRVECRPERDDPITPDIAQLIARAKEAGLRGHRETMMDLRKEAIVRAWTSPDLVPLDQPRVAAFIAEQINAAQPLGVVPTTTKAINVLAAERMPARDATELKNLRLEELLR
jgi:hypothetical protein